MEVGLPRWHSGKNLPANARDARLIPGVRKIPCKRKCQPTIIFSPGKSYRQRSLVGYNPWGHKESDMTEHAQNGIN